MLQYITKPLIKTKNEKVVKKLIKAEAKRKFIITQNFNISSLLLLLFCLVKFLNLN